MSKSAHYLLPVFLFASLSAVCKDKPEKVYPLHGTVLAMRTDVQSRTTPVYTDPYGKTHGGVTANRREHVYTVQTQDMIYEIEGKLLSINEQINFRVQKDRVFVQRDDKETKYLLMGQEAKTPEQTKVH